MPSVHREHAYAGPHWTLDLACARLLGPTKGQGREIVYTLGICSFGGFWDCCLFSGRKELVVLCITVRIHLSIL